MANMSYCRFQNTSQDLQDCLIALEELNEEDENIEKLSEKERSAAQTLYGQCQRYMDAYEMANENMNDTHNTDGNPLDEEMPNWMK